MQRQITPKQIPPPRQYSKNLATEGERSEAGRQTGYDVWIFVGVVIFVVTSIISYQIIPGGWWVIVSIFVAWLVTKVIRDSVYNSNLEMKVTKRLQAEDEMEQRQEKEKTTTTVVKVETIYGAQANNLTTLDSLLEQAEISIEQAQKLFKERAFTPFWDSIEDAVENLRQFDRRVGIINESAKEYYSHLSGREHTFPAFPVKSEELPNPESLMKHLSERIAEAQRDFQFSSIFEQRRTTSAIVTGFRNTQEAITNLQNAVVSSLSDLQGSLESGLEMISSNIHSGFENLAESQRQSAAELRETLDSHAKEASTRDGKHHEFIEGALDNIQNRRKPRLSETKEPFRPK